jgi:hypothetical protein
VSKLTESLREVGVFNPHDFYGKGNVYLAFRRVDSRRCVTSAWGVHRPGFETEPGGFWGNYGNKYFLGGFRGTALVQAQEWAGKRYKIKEWARDPYGSYGDATFIKARIKELKAAMSAKKGQEP